MTKQAQVLKIKVELWEGKWLEFNIHVKSTCGLRHLINFHWFVLISQFVML